jgi:hypothetical protein
MTPPDTNLTKQTRRHRPALYGIAFVVIFGLLTILVRVFVATDPETAPADADPTLRAPIDGQQETSPQATPPQLPAEEPAD